MGWAILAAGISSVEAAFEYDPYGPRVAGLGAAGGALTGDGWAGFRNPALIAESDRLVGAGWSQQFGIPELTLETVGGSVRTRQVTLGVCASTLGSELYRESRLDLLIARRIRPELTAGISIGGRSLSIRNYSGGNALALNAGVVTELAGGVRVAGVWRNVNRAKLSGFSGELPEALVVGTAIEIPQAGVLVGDVVAERRFPLEMRVGAESEVMPNLIFRLGARAEPVRPSAGIEFGVGQWRFHYAVDRHQDLGVSHSVGLEFVPVR